MTHSADGGFEPPRVVFGSSNLGNLFVAPSDEAKLAVMRTWFETVSAPVVIDTAGKYGAGLALEVIGGNLRRLGIPAQDVLISNKLGWIRTPLQNGTPTFEPGAWVDLKHDAEQRISYQGILDCWEEGNRLLGDPYHADLVSVHDPDEYLASASSPEDRTQRLEDVREAYRALAELRDQRKIKGIGIGAKDWRIIREIDQMVAFDWVMIANSLTLYQHPPELLSFIESLRARGIAVINSAIFHSGFLVGGEYFDYRRLDASDPNDAERLAWRERFHGLCQQHNVSASTACIQFGMSPPGVTSLAMNSSRPERIRHDCQAADERIPTAFWEQAKEARLIDQAYPYLA